MLAVCFTSNTIGAEYRNDHFDQQINFTCKRSPLIQRFGFNEFVSIIFVMSLKKSIISMQCYIRVCSHL